MIRVALCAALIAGSTLVSTRSRAGPGDATRLEYARSARAAKCPDRDALKGSVSKRLGYDPFFPAARQTVVVEITDQNDELQAQMSLVDEQGVIVGSRTLRENIAHCDELVASLALAISIALDPSAALNEEPATPEPPKARADEATHQEAQPEPEPAGDSAQPASEPKRATTAAKSRRTAAPSPQSASERAVTARAAAFASLGVAPSLAAGFRVGLGLHRRWFELIAEFAHQFPAQRAAPSGGYARASLNEALLAPCITKDWLAGCALISVGSLQSRGLGVPEPVIASSLYFALGARLELQPRLAGPLYLLLNSDIQKSLTPVTLRLRGEDVWKPPLVSVALGAGLAVRF